MNHRSRYVPTADDTSRPVRRTGRRAAIVLTVAALGTLPAGVASAVDVGFWMYDANQDGAVDASAVDMFGSDNVLDANFLDLTGDGRGDTWLLDMNEDDVVDHIAFDRDEDMRVEELLFDADEDGVFELSIDQTGQDNSADPINWEQVVCPTDPFYCMQWPYVYGNGGATVPVQVASFAAGLENLENASSALGGL